MYYDSWLNNPEVQKVLSRYEDFVIIESTVSIGFNGSTASQPMTVYTPEVDADVLYATAHRDFTNEFVVVRVSSTSPQYQWMADQSNPPVDTPVGAIFGYSTYVTPKLPFCTPYFVEANSKLQFKFVNSPTSLTTGGKVTLEGVKLLRKKPGA